MASSLSSGLKRRVDVSSLWDGSDTEGLAVGLLLSSVMPNKDGFQGRNMQTLEAVKAVVMARFIFAMRKVSK